MPVILFAPLNEASRRIAEKLMGKGFSEKKPGEWALNDVRMIRCDVPTILDIPTDFETDYLLVLSTHKSKEPKPMLTAHFPGNWGKADMGGGEKTLNFAYGSKLRQVIHALKRNAEKNKLDWPVVMEADHHGPTCPLPIIYVEIGSSEKEWKDEKAAETVAESVLEVLWENPAYESAVGFGGGHYARGFTGYILKEEKAVGHICAKYNIETLDEGVFLQAFGKNVEKVDEALVLKEETNLKQKEKVKRLCGKFGIRYREI